MAQVCAVTPRPGAILIVEDRSDVRGGLFQLLELSGFDAAAAETGEQALRRLSSAPDGFALVLLDLFLPGTLSGWDLRARQLADPRLARVPTVVITACELRHEERDALRTDGWLEKPFRAEALFEVVRRFVVARQ
jgi:CheY-like chemotaxis protein